MSNNDVLNEAVWKFSKESQMNNDERSNIVSELRGHIARAYFNEPITSYIADGLGGNIPFEDRKNAVINFDKMFTDAMQFYEKEINKIDNDPKFVEQIKFLKKGYSEIIEYYNELKDRPQEPVYA
jgi:hypothetical protein